jgi:hypothetical protein
VPESDQAAQEFEGRIFLDQFDAAKVDDFHVEFVRVQILVQFTRLFESPLNFVVGGGGDREQCISVATY